MSVFLIIVMCLGFFLIYAYFHDQKFVNDNPLMSEEKKKEINKGGRRMLLIGVVLVLLSGFFLTRIPSSGGSSNNHDTCGYCGRHFTDSANISSIARTHLCVNCYNNYKWADEQVNGK